MSITLNWKFPKVEKTKISDLSDVIHSVEYLVDGTDGTNTITRYGKVLLDPPDADSFIPYTDITHSLVVEWITARFPELLTAITENITAELARLSDEGSKGEVVPHFSES